MYANVKSIALTTVSCTRTKYNYARNGVRPAPTVKKDVCATFKSADQRSA